MGALWEYLGYGLVLGLTAGVSPGPLLAVVVTQTVRYGAGEGFKVAVAPLLTDLPIILAALLLLTRIPQRDLVLGVVSLLGALFLAYLGYDTLRARVDEEQLLHTDAPRSWQRGLLVNALSPHPYLFWFAVGVPIMLEASRQAPGAAFGFAFLFFALLVGSKMGVALMVERSRRFLLGSRYRRLLQILGICLLIFSLRLFWQALDLLAAGTA
ncbi:MAG: LysE family translocator [Gammaproteobacteria bacterium]